MSIERFKSMSQYSIEEIPRSSLLDIRDVKIDDSLPGTFRMIQYLEQIPNPYCFLCDGTPVHISFVNEEQELSKALVNYFRNLI